VLSVSATLQTRVALRGICSSSRSSMLSVVAQSAGGCAEHCRQCQLHKDCLCMALTDQSSLPLVLGA
jgi:hypothetical protein